MDTDIQFMGFRLASEGPTASPVHAITGITLEVLDVPGCGEQPRSMSFYKSSTVDAVHIGRMSSTADADSDHGVDSARFRCPVISRKHAKFVFGEVGVSIVDLNSHHATYILKTGDAVATILKPGVHTALSESDIVTFGKTVGRDTDLVRPVSVRVHLLHGVNPSLSGSNATPTKGATTFCKSGDGAQGALQRSISGRYGLHVPNTFSSDESSCSEHDSDIEEIPPPAHMSAPRPSEHVAESDPSESSNSGGPLPSLQGLGLLARYMLPHHMSSRFIRPFDMSPSSQSQSSDHGVDTARLSFPHDNGRRVDEADELDSLYDIHSQDLAPIVVPIHDGTDSESAYDSLYNIPEGSKLCVLRIPSPVPQLCHDTPELASSAPSSSSPRSPPPNDDVHDVILSSAKCIVTYGEELDGVAAAQETLPAQHEATNQGSNGVVQVISVEHPPTPVIIDVDCDAEDPAITPAEPMEVDEVTAVKACIQKLNDDVSELKAQRRRLKVRLMTHMGNTAFHERRLGERLDNSNEQLLDLETRICSLEDDIAVLRNTDDARLEDQNRDIEILQAQIDRLASPNITADMASASEVDAAHNRLRAQEDGAKVAIASLKNMVEEMTKLRDNIRLQMQQELLAAQQTRAEMTALLERTVAQDVSNTPSRKRRRDLCDDCVDEDGDVSNLVQDDVLLVRRTSRKRSKIADTLVKTAATAAVGAVAAWGVLAFA